MRVNRRTFLGRSLGAVAAANLGGAGLTLGAPAVRAAGQPVVLKLAHPDAPTHPAQEIATQFGKLVQERTDGSVTVRVFAGGQLGSEVNIVSGLSTGIVDLAMHTTGFLESLFPKIQAIDLPFLFPNNAAAERVLDGPIGQELLTDMQTKGIYGLTWGHYGWRVVENNTRPIVVPQDLQGMKIRIQPGAVFAASFKAVGAVPIVIDLNELYIALSQGTVNAYELPFVPAVTTKLLEVTKYIGETNHVYNGGAFMASKMRFDSLTPKEQGVIRETAREMGPLWRKAITERTVVARKACEDKGIKINAVDFPAFKKAMDPVYTEFRDKIGAEFVDKVIKAANA